MMKSTAEPISLKRAHATLKRRSGTWLWPTLLAPAVAVLVACLWPCTYVSQAQILVHESAAFTPHFDALPSSHGQGSRFSLIHGVLTSRATLERALSNDGVQPRELSPIEREKQVEAMRESLHFLDMGRGLTLVRCVAASPQESLACVESTIDAFKSELQLLQQRAMEKPNKALRTQIARLKDELRENEKRIRAFLREHDLDFPGHHQEQIDSHLALRGELTSAKGSFEAALRRRRAAENNLRLHDPELDALRVRLRRAEAKRDQLRLRYTDAHPELVEAIAEVKQRQDAVSRYARSRRSGVPQSLHEGTALAVAQDGNGESTSSTVIQNDIAEYKEAVSDFESSRGRLEVLEGRHKRSLRNVRALGIHERVLSNLLRESEIKSEAYARLLARQEEAKLVRELASSETNAMWIVEPPTLPAKAKAPPLLLVLVGSLIAGLSLGMLLCFALEALNPLLQCTDDVHRSLGIPVIGVLPRSPMPVAHQSRMIQAVTRRNRQTRRRNWLPQNIS